MFLLTPPMKMEQTECFETSVHKIHTSEDHPKERIQIDVCQTDVFQETVRTKLAPLLFFFCLLAIYCIY